jgi:hypothetical protein
MSKLINPAFAFAVFAVMPLLRSLFALRKFLYKHVAATQLVLTGRHSVAALSTLNR